MIRHATTADSRRIAEIQVASWLAAYRGILPDKHLDDLDADVRERVWLGLCENPDSPLFVADVNNGVVGFCHVCPSRDEDGGSAAEITSIYLDPTRWREGFGRELVSTAFDFSRQRGFDRITLWVLVENHPARRFYETMGFLAEDSADRNGCPGFNFHQIRYRRDIPK